MRVIKNINNNVAVCVDSSGKELIAFGKGIGYRKPPYDIDISQIHRTYYNLDSKYVSILENINDEIIQLAIDIREYTESKNILTSNKLVVSLADHISYAIERVQQGITFSLPIANDVLKMFPEEIEIGKYALELIEERLNQKMPEDEAIYIAIDILNSELETNKKWSSEGQLVEQIVEIVSEMMNIQIDKKSFFYSRFVSHLYYLLERTDQESLPDREVLLNSIRYTNPREYECALAVKELIDEAHSRSISDDEILYLTLHISRLYGREKNK